MGSMNITEEQKKFLEECENEFEERFTEEDSEFMKIKTMELIIPPIMDPWHNKPRRSHDDWSRNQGHGRRNNDRNKDGWTRRDRIAERRQRHRVTHYTKL